MRKHYRENILTNNKLIFDSYLPKAHRLIIPPCSAVPCVGEFPGARSISLDFFVCSEGAVLSMNTVVLATVT